MKTRSTDSDKDSGSEPEQQHNNKAAAAAAARRQSGGTAKRGRGSGAGGATPAALGGADGSASNEENSDSDGPSTSGGRGDGSSSGGSSDGRGGGGGDSDDEAVLERQLADIPLGLLARLKGDGVGPVGDAARAAAAAAKQRAFKRETKNRPQEVSSKRPVPRFREVIQVPKHRGIDPRFDASLGRAGGSDTRQQGKARRQYAFLYDEVLPQEHAALKQRLKKEKREGKRREIQAELARLEQRLKDERSRRKREELDKGWKAQEKAAVAAGKKPYYLKKSEKRKRELVARYEELKSSGQLDKFMAKRRRKNASVEHKYLPGRAE